MDAEIKKRLCDALRSGKYKQGKRYLHRYAEWCCLGVLCDIMKDEVGGKWHEGRFTVGYDWSTSLLPPAVSNHAGLVGSNPEVLGLPLSARNDGNGIRQHTFPEIADLIEKHL